MLVDLSCTKNSAQQSEDVPQHACCDHKGIAQMHTRFAASSCFLISERDISIRLSNCTRPRRLTSQTTQLDVCRRLQNDNDPKTPNIGFDHIKVLLLIARTMQSLRSQNKATPDTLSLQEQPLHAECLAVLLLCPLEVTEALV